MPDFCVFDIEAADWVKFRVLGFYDGEAFRTFRSISLFLDHVLRHKYRNKNIYAHYGGKYDFLFLLDELFKRSAFRVEIMDGGSRIIQITVSRGKDKWRFCDSFALLPTSLKELARSFKTPHQKQEFDVGAEKDFTSRQALQYLENDCLALYEVLQAFKGWGSNGGKLKATLAGQALYIFRNQFLSRRLYTVGEEDEAFIRRCYYGGRTEIFKMRCGKAYYYDVNSMYPWAMCQKMPCGAALRVSQYHPRAAGFYRIRVSIPYCHIPFIPTVAGGKLIFPCGDFEAYLATPEIEMLIASRIPFEVKEGLIFTECEDIFSEYVNFHYGLKMNSVKGSADYLLSKLYLNALYGKFGQRREKESIVRVSDFEEVYIKHLTPYFEDLGLYKMPTTSRSLFILPYLSAYITSLSRVKLHGIIRQAGEENAVYCDTDSLISTRELPTGKALGELKLEDEIKEGIFIQPKVYMLLLNNDKCIIRIKGFSSHSCTYKDFSEALRLKDPSRIRTKIYRITGYKENIKRFKSASIRRICQEKGLTQEYSKRLICGYETKPLTL